MKLLKIIFTCLCALSLVGCSNKKDTIETEPLTLQQKQKYVKEAFDLDDDMFMFNDDIVNYSYDYLMKSDDEKIILSDILYHYIIEKAPAEIAAPVQTAQDNINPGINLAYWIVCDPESDATAYFTYITVENQDIEAIFEYYQNQDGWVYSALEYPHEGDQISEDQFNWLAACFIGAFTNTVNDKDEAKAVIEDLADSPYKLGEDYILYSDGTAIVIQPYEE